MKPIKTGMIATIDGDKYRRVVVGINNGMGLDGTNSCKGCSVYNTAACRKAPACSEITMTGTRSKTIYFHYEKVTQ